MARLKADERLRTEYRLLLERARLGNTKAVSNRFPWQAQEAIQALSDFANQLQSQWGATETPVVIRILTGALPNHVFGRASTIAALTKFLRAGGEIRVIVWAESIDTSTNLFCQLAKSFPRQVSIRLSRTDDLGNRLNHFFIVCDCAYRACAYRLEEPHPKALAESFDDFEPAIPAKITFDEKDVAKNRAEFFDSLWGSVTPLA
jgi:hypothetical protein